jgi:2-keto-4-pentenoate hydratase/2-oxohepta-3-ene-1,7-dioic acid hydratase in catechol pathway
MMKLIRFGKKEKEKPGLIIPSGTRIDVSSFGEDYNEIFFETDGIGRLKEWLKTNQSKAPIINSDIRLGPPICRPSKLICIGLNFSDHAKESGARLPTEPVVFFKATSAIVGPNDNLIIPKNSEKTDWEVELALVIGKKASHVEEKNASGYVAGYLLHNDYSERKFQLEQGGQWVKGKSCDSFAPIGPFLVTKDEIEDVQNLQMWLKVNGEIRQVSSTKNMIFSVTTLVSYLSKFMTLFPGDIISTGTPAGVGLGFNPPQYLKPGDIIELGIDQLGSSRQIAVAYSE